jgi:ABC-type molybdate transport system substrate-binding protein
MNTIRLLAGAFALATGVLAAEANADELKVLSVDEMRAALQELAPAFEAASKHKLVIAFAPDAEVEKTVASDDSIDIAILTKARIDKLVNSARILTFPKVLAQGSSPDLVYVVGSSMATEQPLAAKALMDFLAGPEAKKVYAAKGLQPS